MQPRDDIEEVIGLHGVADKSCTYQDQRDKEYQENKKIVEAVTEEVSGLREEEECILKEKAAVDAKLKKVRQDIAEIEGKRGLAIAKKKMAMFAPQYWVQ